ncbi:MAG: tetratricopeptide repeat protein [Niabella sp.]
MSNAQDGSKTDSLLGVLKSAKEDENKVLLLIEIGQHFEHTDLEKAKSYYLQARKLGERINYPLTEVKFASNYTFALNMQGKFDSSLYWNLHGIEAAKKLNSDELLAKAYFNTGTSYQYLSDYQPAVENYQKGLVLFEKVDDKVLKAQANDILQVLYTSMKQYDKAKEHGKKAIAMFRNLENPKLLAYSLNNLGVCFAKSNQKDSALNYHEEAMKLAKQINDEILIATTEINIADLLFSKKQYLKSKNLYESALEKTQKNNIPESETIALRGLSYYYMQTNDIPKSIQYAEKALAVSEKYQILQQKALNLDQLANLAYASGNFSKAAYLEKEISVLNDSILNEQILQSTINTEKKFELDKKNTQLKLQEASITQKNTLNYILIGGAVALLTILLLSYRNYNHRRKLQQQRITELETEKQLLATQSLLKGQEDERARVAKDLHDGLGGLLSGVKLQLGAMKGNLILTEENGIAFNRALDGLDTSIAEMRRVAHNMMPEALIRLGLQQALQDYCDGLSQNQPFTINTEFHGLEKRMDNTVEVVAYRIIQELLNNAVKHSGAANILVQVVRQDENNLSITIEDDGKGFDVTKVNTANSAGLRNIQSRVNYLNGKMDILSAPGKGTSVYIDCKILL